MMFRDHVKPEKVTFLFSHCSWQPEITLALKYTARQCYNVRTS